MENMAAQFTILLADNESSILNGLEESIDWADLGIRVVSLAQDGRQALDAIIEYRPDFAVIDIKMPFLSGIDVISRTRNAGIQTDFIILSGYDDFAYAKEAIRYGAKAYLLKPFNPSELYDELYRLCLDHSRNDRRNSRRVYEEKLNLSFFNKLIDSKIMEPGIISQLLNSNRLNLSDSSCYVCVLIFDEASFPSQETIPAEAMVAALNRRLSEEKHILWAYNARQIVGIFNTSDVIPFQTATKCLDTLTAGGFSLPVIGIGDPVSGLMECSYSYNRALTAVTYQLYSDTARIFTYENICTTPPTMTLADIDDMALVQSIVRKDAGGIRDYCNGFIDRLLYVPMPPPNYVFGLCYALFHKVEEEFSSFSHQEISNIASAQDLYRFRTLHEIRDWMIRSFTQLSEFIDAVYGYATPKYARSTQETLETDDSIIRDAREFIHNNITNHLRINDIARHVHLSPSYFAIYFKSKTNVNLRDYLLAEKMEYARRALTNPDTPISDVAYAIGYGDYRSFSRAFKNVHGITPSDFQAKYK